MGRNVNLKLAVYGEGAVGKTSLINVFLGKEVPEKYMPTINSKVSKKDYVLKKTGVTFKLNIWDVGGNRAINPIINNAFYTDVDLVLMVFDLTRPELTLKAHQKNFLDRIKRFSEEPLTLVVGNKLDKLLFNNDFKKAVQKYLGEKKSFSITSATSKLNVNNCIELLLYTFLKKSEIVNPDLVPENSGSEFIEIIGKSAEELRDQLVNLATIDLKHSDLKPKIKVVDETSKEEDKEKKYHEFIQQELQKISTQKGKLTDKFLETITEMEEKLTNLKRQKIKSSTELVDKLKISVEISKKDCEQHLETLTKLYREEKELLIISSKVREEKLAELPEKLPTTLEVKESIPESISPGIKVKPKPLKVKSISKPEPKPIEVKSKSKPEPKPIEVKVISKPEPKPIKVKTITKPEPKPLEDKTISKPEPEIIEVETIPKPEPEIIEVEAIPKPKPKPLEVKTIPKPEPKIIEVEVIPKPEPEIIEVEAISKPELKPVEAKTITKLDLKPLEVKIKPKPKLKHLEVKATPKPKPKPSELKVKLKPIPKPLEVKTIPKPKPKPKTKLTPTPKSSKVVVKQKPKVKPSILKEVKIASKPIKKDPKIELYNKYEKVNPGKRAVYRGKETKGFLEWKKQNS